MTDLEAMDGHLHLQAFRKTTRLDEGTHAEILQLHSSCAALARTLPGIPRNKSITDQGMPPGILPLNSSCAAC